MNYRIPLFKIAQEDFNSIEYVLKNSILKTHARITRNKTIKKLNNLNIRLNTNDLLVNSQFNNNIAEEILLHTANPVFDLSNSLDNDEIGLLGKGLKYGIKKRTFNKFEILTRFEELAQNLDKEDITDVGSNDIYETTPKESFLQKLSNLTYGFIESAKTPQSSLTFDEEKTLLKLKSKVKDNELIVSKSDKGNATVVTNKAEYIEKMETILSDKTKFELLENQSENLIQKMEDSFNTYLYNIKDKYEKVITYDEKGKKTVENVLKTQGSINQRIYKQIYSTGARCGVAYGLTKVHKNGNPIRPIISTIGTYNYKASDYLTKVLTSAIKEKGGFKYVVKDSFDFINKLSQIKLEEGECLISFDVESLFTNVPIDETIEIIKNTFFTLKNNSNKIRANAKDDSRYEGKLDNMKFEVFEKLYRKCLQESIFMFNNKLFKQINGVSMGNKLGPTTSDFFMNDFENKHMEQLRYLGVKHWFRYVDDTFVIVKNINQADDILNYLNKQHNTIKFTMEKEISNKINFLDITIKRKSDLTFETSTYRKPTFTGVMLNWNSLTSIKYKTGLIRCLLDRSYKICSSEKQKEIEMAQLRLLLLKNNYPIQIIEREFKRFINAKSKELDNKLIDDEIKIKYLSLPYINDKTEVISTKIKDLVKQYYPKIHLRVAFKSPAQLGDHFPFKDKVNDPSKQSFVVYHAKCMDCENDYIGMTTQILNERIHEHLTDKDSHIYQHIHASQPKHRMDFENIVILDRASNALKLQYKEMLYIRKLNPSLNRQMNSELFSFVIRNAIKDSDITKDIQKYLKSNKNEKRS